jgi:hypothetical protein
VTVPIVFFIGGCNLQQQGKTTSRELLIMLTGPQLSSAWPQLSTVLALLVFSQKKRRQCHGKTLTPVKDASQRTHDFAAVAAGGEIPARAIATPLDGYTRTKMVRGRRMGSFGQGTQRNDNTVRCRF